MSLDIPAQFGTVLYPDSILVVYLHYDTVVRRNINIYEKILFVCEPLAGYCLYCLFVYHKFFIIRMRDLLSEVSHSTERMQSYLYFSYIFNNNKKISISLTLINSIRRYKSSTLPADATLLMYGDDIVVSKFPGSLRGFPSPAALLSRAGIITLRPLLRCCLWLPLSPCGPLHGLYARGGLHAYDIYACWRLGEVYGYALCGPHVLVCLCVA